MHALTQTGKCKYSFNGIAPPQYYQNLRNSPVHIVHVFVLALLCQKGLNMS